MWRSEEDVIKDLAFLSDFGIPGDRETYQVLYSIRRGLKLDQKIEYPKTFIDQKTGESIDINDTTLDLNDLHPQGKGRGTTIGSLSKTQFQLIQQLRLARPLGSGDGIIESYCRRNRPVKKSPNNKPNISKVEITSKTKTTLPSCTEKKKIKATRCSNLQSNALIEGLLAKARKENEHLIENDSLTGILCSNYDRDNLSDAENQGDSKNIIYNEVDFPLLLKK